MAMVSRLRPKTLIRIFSYALFVYIALRKGLGANVESSFALSVAALKSKARGERYVRLKLWRRKWLISLRVN